MANDNNFLVSFNLNDDELYQFYWNLYGSSLVKYQKATEVKEGYSQLLKQIEDYLIRKNPDNLFAIQKLKKNIRDSIFKKKEMN